MDNVLMNFVADSLDALRQFFCVPHLCLVNLFLHYGPHLVVTRFKSGLLSGHIDGGVKKAGVLTERRATAR